MRSSPSRSSCSRIGNPSTVTPSASVVVSFWMAVSKFEHANGKWAALLAIGRNLLDQRRCPGKFGKVAGSRPRRAAGLPRATSASA